MSWRIRDLICTKASIYLFLLSTSLGKIRAAYVRSKEKMMKKLMLAVAPVVLALTACATTTGTGTGGASAQTTTQQLGVAALKVAVNAKCITEINNVAAWKTATKYMTAEQRDSIQTNVCGCVSEKAPNSVTAVELAAAALDVNARATIVNQVVSKTVNACVAEALQK
ncbi:conserved hypothetical protein; putative exported protein [Acinetobacter baumannii AYE]|nr:conserved hypothetical protein; putative exported protein [Acinetobacter baumannii AYE]